MAKRVADVLTVEQFNDLLDYFDLINQPYTIDQTVWTIYIKTKGKNYKTSLAGDKFNYPDPKEVSKQFHAKTKYPYIEGKYGYKMLKGKDGKTKVKWAVSTANGYSYTNDKYARKFLRCWSYDINSAYSYAMLKPMPDTTVEPRLNSIVGKNEIGFYKTGGATITEGDYADFVFPLISSYFAEYIKEYYSKKENAIDKLYRKIWKQWLNVPTGCVERHNIFIRNAIIFYSNEYIKSFIDDNTVYCNVDCIVSLVPRPDIPQDDNEIGMFKNEHKNTKFKFISAGNYQWENECHMKGIKGKYITDIENTNGWWEKAKSDFKYKFDETTRRIITNE